MDAGIERKIMSKKHYFIYGADQEKRTSLLQEVVNQNPIVLDDNRAIGIILDCNGLPEITDGYEEIDRSKVSILAREYFASSLMLSILNSFSNQVDCDKERERISYFLRDVGNMSGTYYDSIKEYARQIKESRDLIYEYYFDYFRTGDVKGFPNCPVFFIMLEYFIRKFREMLNNREHLALFVDNKSDLSIPSQKVINGLICSKINDDLSINVATLPEDWKTYYSGDDFFAEYRLDYDVIELDGSLKEYVKKKSF